MTRHLVFEFIEISTMQILPIPNSIIHVDFNTDKDGLNSLIQTISFCKFLNLKLQVQYIA